jgi:ribosomal protein L31
MKPLIRFFTYSFFLVFLNSCGQIFEVDADVQARQALLDLMKIQEKFYQENKRYATRFGEIEKYNLKYHSGIVYLEIESAGKDTYRAISLPAESTTARVFAYDSNQGGFYEMEGEEVSKYVLGALRHIRVQKQEKDLIELTGWMMMAGMCFLGLRFFSRYRCKENNPALWAYILCLPPLGWAVSLLGNMEANVVFTPTIAQATWVCLGLALSGLGLGGLWLMKNKTPPAPLLSLSVCTLGICLLSAGVMVHMLKTFA